MTYFSRQFEPADSELWRRTGHAQPELLCHPGRAYPAHVADEDDAARDMESEDGRDDHERAVFWRVYAAILIAVLVVIFWPY